MRSVLRKYLVSGHSQSAPAAWLVCQSDVKFSYCLLVLATPTLRISGVSSFDTALPMRNLSCVAAGTCFRSAAVITLVFLLQLIFADAQFTMAPCRTDGLHFLRQ